MLSKLWYPPDAEPGSEGLTSASFLGILWERDWPQSLGELARWGRVRFSICGVLISPKIEPRLFEKILLCFPEAMLGLAFKGRAARARIRGAPMEGEIQEGTSKGS